MREVTWAADGTAVPSCPASNALDCYAQDLRWAAALRSARYPDNVKVWQLEERQQEIVRLILVHKELHAAGLTLRSFGTPLDSCVNLSDIFLDKTAATDRTFDAALDALAESAAWDVLRFHRVRQRGHLFRGLQRSSYEHTLADAGDSAYCDVSTAHGLSALSKDHLRNVDRLRRRASKEFGAVETITAADETVATSAFDRFVAVESSGWKAGAGTALAFDIGAQRFYREVVRRFQPEGDARIDFLTIDGRDAAAQLAVRTGTTWFLLKIGYHPDFRDVGPGAILLKDFLERMRDDTGVSEVNLTTSPPWAARWHFRQEPCFHVHVYGRTWRGRALAAAHVAKATLRTLRDTLPRRSTPAKP